LPGTDCNNDKAWDDGEDEYGVSRDEDDDEGRMRRAG
jgi:hypothetical protein